MAKSREYAYYVKGNKIAVVEKDETGADGLNYTYSDCSGLDLPSGTGTWKSPQEAVTGGLRIGYSERADNVDGVTMTNEGHDVPVDEFLAKAVVDYVKARLAEDMGDLEKREYFMREFHRKISKYENTKFAGPRSVVPGVKWQ